MENNTNIKSGSKIMMKKTHPCGTNLWEVLRIGTDVKIRCVKCKREIMTSRLEFDKKIKKVVEE